MGKSMSTKDFGDRMALIKPRLYRTACLYLNSDAMAADAVDEAEFRAFVAIKKLRQPQFFDTWVTRILINECKKALRRAKRYVPYEAAHEQAAEDFDALPLKDAIARLPQELRAVIALRYFSGYTTVETAQILDIPQGTAATRCRRALQLLRLELSDEL